MLAQQITTCPINSSYPTSPKFLRRDDLTLAIRTQLVFDAYMAQIKHNWGQITQLSQQYEVSRTFIYTLLSNFKEEMGKLFFPQEKPTCSSPSKEDIEACILSQRFEGRCSIDAISTIMKRWGMPNSSVGSISQFLSHLGELLPNTLQDFCETKQLLIFANDEVFAKSLPILITVDPISSAIIRIELSDQRTADVWINHFQAIQNNGISAQRAISDNGTGLCAAQKEMFADVTWQSDTFHGIAHRLGDWSRRLEKSAYKAIEYEEERYRILDSAVSDDVIDKRINLYIAAGEFTAKAISLYEQFDYLYKILINELNVFDSNGRPREPRHVKENMEIALELMVLLGHKGIIKEVNAIKKALPDLLTYFDDVDIAIKNCQKLSDNKDALQALYLAWQWNKAVIKSKVCSRRHKAIEERDFYLELAALFIADNDINKTLKENVYAELDMIVQASSMVECINSILRPYLNNSKNQLTQEFLNIFMFYHNHRRYHAGKRKGRTPMEILTGQPQTEDWITLLLKDFEFKEQSCLLAA